MTGKISARPYEKGDLDPINPKSIFSPKRDVQTRIHLHLNAKGFHAYTLLLDGTPVGVVGVNTGWVGVGEVWTFLGDEIRHAPISFMKVVKNLLGRCNEFGFHRLQMTVRREYTEGIKFAQALDFESEGLLRQYGPDRADHIMFSRVTNG